MTASLFSQGQLASFDFTNATDPPAGWLTNATLDIQSYQSTSNSCAVNDGMLVDPGGNPVNFLTPELTGISNDLAVTFRFIYHAYIPGTTTFACNQQANVACNANVTLYVVRSTYNSLNTPTPADILGSGSMVVAPGVATTVTAPISVPISQNSAFKIFLDVNIGSCVAGARYIVDNIAIDLQEQTVTPVSFKSFNAVRNKANVGISWTTASEQNNNGFYVQRNDGSGWRNVAFIFSKAATGNSSSDLTYSYSDLNNIKGVSQYRIVQVDIDGKSKLSDIRSVKGEGQLAKILVYPNPSTTGNVNVVFDDQSSRDVQIRDFAGRLIKRYVNVINNLAIQGLQSGVYTVQVSDRVTGSKAVNKVVVR